MSSQRMIFMISYEFVSHRGTGFLCLQLEGLGGFWGPQSTKIIICIIAHGEAAF